MKEAVTKFDLESAFKALDEIDVPVAESGIKANRPALTEIFSRKSKFESLFEEYYDINTVAGLDDAKEAREAEIAKAKLARIEKIVDLDAKSPEDLLTSYVGKYIMQCPQCMTLFYKDKEDVVESEEDPTTVNVGEACQHCGNESGYTLVGKVGEAEEEAPAEETEVNLDEVPAEDAGVEEPTEEHTEDVSEEPVEDASEEEFDLDTLELDDKEISAEEEEEKKEESYFTSTVGAPLTEEIEDDKELDAKLKAHNEFIEFLRHMISQEEEALARTDNELVKAAIQRRIDGFREDLEAALPDTVKANLGLETEEDAVAEEAVEATEAEKAAKEVSESLTEALHEAADVDVSADEFEKLINSPEFKKPISDSEVRAMLNAEEEPTEGVKESVEGEQLEEGIFDTIKNKVSDALDDIASKLKTRSAKADWVRDNAMEDYSKAQAGRNGKLIVDKENQKFTTFLVIGFTEKDAANKRITAPLAPTSKRLICGMAQPVAKKAYTDADDLAKGWSLRDGNGPAFIYLAKNANDEEAVFLCEYFQGKLAYDKLEEHFESVRNNLKSVKLTSRGGMGVANKPSQATTSGEESKTESIHTKNTLGVLMTEVEELNESSLEKLISDSLVESYGNIAGYRLTGCEYLDGKLNVEGTIYFTSGNTRKTTYTFVEAFVDGNKVQLRGLNEKLGLEKGFTINGRVDNQTKTLITESFSVRK